MTHRRGGSSWGRLIVPVVAAAGFAAGCAGAAGGAAPATQPGSSTQPPASVVLDERANGRTVRAGTGEAIELDLHSSYWRHLRSTAPAVVAQEGSTALTPGTCRPGIGCGTFRTRFRAAAAGTARLVADRTSCGEARSCSSADRTLMITIVVG